MSTQRGLETKVLCESLQRWTINDLVCDLSELCIQKKKKHCVGGNSQMAWTFTSILYDLSYKIWYRILLERQIL